MIAYVAVPLAAVPLATVATVATIATAVAAVAAAADVAADVADVAADVAAVVAVAAVGIPVCPGPVRTSTIHGNHWRITTKLSQNDRLLLLILLLLPLNERGCTI